jgi:hypothetical protein
MAHFQADDPRAVLVVAVSIISSAVDNQQQYRPQESPANIHLTGRAGDASG